MAPQGIGCLPPMLETWIELWAPDFEPGQPRLLQAFVIETVDARSLCFLSLSFSLPVCLSSK